MLDADPAVGSIESALLAMRVGDPRLARDHLRALDATHLRQLRVALYQTVSGRSRAPALALDQRAKRSSVSATARRAVFERDQYTCRLCGRRTVDVDVLRSLSREFPDELPYDPHWNFEKSSLIYWTHTASLEHLVPIARGGADDETNFVTSCYACNDARADYLLEELGWTLRPVSATPWDGLRRYLFKTGA